MSGKVEELRDAFTLFDKVGDGKISKDDLGSCMRACNHNPTQAEVEKILADLGADRVSFEQFLPLVKDAPKTHGTEEEFIDGLRVFDNDGSGTMQVSELRQVLMSLGERLTSEEVDALLDGFPQEKDGTINYEEFVRKVMAG